LKKNANYRILVAIETDATRYHGAHASRPCLLPKSASEQMLAHVSADLKALLSDINRCSLVAAGALFDQTQILRPGYPVFGALQKLAQQSADKDRAAQISLGAENDRIPVIDLQPDDTIPLGILQLLPVLVSGDKDAVSDLGMAMEHRFIEEGQVSAHTAQWMENAFGIGIRHARFMTLMDLNAMFRLQLEHFGFLPLWQLLDAALTGLDETLEVSLDNGQVFTWRAGAVHTRFETFDYWSQAGGGKHLDSKRGHLADAYAEWTRTLRQILTMLRAHDVQLEFHLPEQQEQALDGSFFIEQSTRRTGSRCAEVTEHSSSELGTICISVVSNSVQDNYYPLTPEGLNDIQQVIRERGLGGQTIAFPGCILCDEAQRVLMAEPVSGHLHH